MGHYLSLLLALPVCGAAGVMCIPGRQIPTIRALARAVAAATLLLALPLWTWYRPTNPEFQLVERVGSIPMLGASYIVGIDGISLMFVLLAATLGLVATLLPLGAATGRITGDDTGYYATLLMHEAALLGVFLSLDTLLFSVCWLVALLTMWRLASESGGGSGGGSGAWSGARSRARAARFARWSVVSFVAVLFGVVALAVLAHQANGANGFDLTVLQKLSISSGPQAWICASFLVGFIVAMSLVPLRGWLPDTLADAPPGAAVMLSGMLVKVGAFGLVRFTLPLVPEAVRAASPYVAGLAIAGVVLTTIFAVRQTDWLGVVGYLTMSQAALTLLGLMTLMPRAVTGGVVLAVTHGLASAAAIVAVGRVGARLGTRDTAALRGRRPVLSSAMAVASIVAVLSIASPIASRVHLPALKVAARVDPRFEAEFLAACDTTVTPELKAASAANQFLAAAPCGPDGTPLGSPALAPSTSVTGAP